MFRKYALSAFFMVFLAAAGWTKPQTVFLFKLGEAKPPNLDAVKVAIFNIQKSAGPLRTVDITLDSGGFLSEGSIQKIMAFVKVQDLTDRQSLVFEWQDKVGNPIGGKNGFAFESEITNGTPAQANGLSNKNADQDELSIPAKNEFCTTIMDTIATQAKSFQADGYTALIFDENLHLFYQNRQFGVAGDLIFVAVFHKDLVNLAVEFSPCNLEPEIPHLFVGDTSGLSKFQSNGFVTLIFPPRRCFNTSVAIKVKATQPGPNNKMIEGNMPLSQYDRYRGTLQMGVLYTDQHELAYGLRTADDTKKYIYSKGPADSGPEYTASLVIYSVLRYVENIFSTKKHFAGRDIINDRSFIDSLGAVIGVGLTNPANRFVLGLSYEIAYGINLIGVVEFAKLTGLGAGLSEGAEYSGTEDAIPIRHYWGNKFVFGLSLDLRYVTALFSRK